MTELSLDNSQGQLDWVSSVSIQASGNGLPTVNLATYTVPSTGASSELNFDVVMSGSQAFTYLSSGPVTLTITLGSSTVSACQALTLVSEASLSSDVNLCVSGSGTFSKSL